MMRTETTTSFENDYSSNNDVEVSNIDDGDELPL